MKDKRNRVQVVAWSVCALLLVALITLVYTDRKNYQKRIIEMQLEAQSQSEESENSFDTEAANNIYNELIDNLSLPNIICWGDDEMIGNGKYTLPKALESIANEKLLSSLSECFGSKVDIRADSVPSILINNMGVSNEGMEEILTRSGVDELEVGEWVLIPSDKKPVNLVFRDGDTGNTLHFGKQKETTFGKVEISGVEGVLTKGDGEYDEEHPRFAFVRDEKGDSFQAGMGTKIEVESATKFLGYIPILFLGEESLDTVDSVDEFVGDLERLVERYTEIEEEDSEPSEKLPYVVICTVDEDSELDESMREAFSDRYIRNDTNASEMKENDYKKLAQKVYTNLDGQGCFDQVKEMIENAAEELKAFEQDKT